MSLTIRKLLTIVEEIRSEGDRVQGPPLRKVAAAAVVVNPYAGRPYSERLDEIVEPSAELATLLGRRAGDALGTTPESYGKAALVGEDGEQEHAVAIITSVMGDSFREAIGGGMAWLPSVSKRCAAGTSVDVPLCFKDEIWVRSHYDTITVAIPDAPLRDEIVLVVALASRGRLNARLGGKSKADAVAGAS